MAVPPNGQVKLGLYSSNESNERALFLTLANWHGFITQLKVILGNPAPLKAAIRGELVAKGGDVGESDLWFLSVCSEGRYTDGPELTEDEINLLKAELLP